MKANLQCSHCGKTFENIRLLNNHYNQLGVDHFRKIFKEFEKE